MVDDVSGNRRVPLETERTHRLHERTGKRNVPYEVIIDEHHVPHPLRANLVHHRLNRAVKVMSAHARSAVVAKVTGERTSPALGDHVSIQALRRIGVAEVRCRQRLALEVRPGHILPLERPSLHIRQQLRPMPLRRTNADRVEVRTRRVRVRSDADSTGDNRNALLAAKLRQIDCMRQTSTVTVMRQISVSGSQRASSFRSGPTSCPARRTTPQSSTVRDAATYAP